MCDWHWAFTADWWDSRGLVGFVRFPLAGELQCRSWNWPSLGEGTRWGTSLHSPSVSLVGVKKRTKVIKNNVNPVWNEVCELPTFPPFLPLLLLSLQGRVRGLRQRRLSQWCCHGEEGLWSGVPTKSSWHQEPGRRGGGLAGGLPCDVGTVWRGVRGSLSLLLSALASQEEGV